MNIIINYIKKNILFLVLISQPLLDILAYFQEGSSFSIAGYVRLVYTIVIPLYTLIVLKDKKKFFAIMCAIVGFCALHIANGLRVGYIDMFADIKYMLLVLHMPILLISFIYLYSKEENMKQALDALKVNAVIIVVAFFISYALQIGNYTYADYKQGWTGWYVVPNAQSLIIVSLLPFIVYFLLKYCKKLFPLPMLVAVFMYLANGTKTTYYSVILILAGFFCFIIFEFLVKRDKKFSVYTLCMILGVIALTIFFYNYSPRMNMDTGDEIAREQEQEQLEQEKAEGMEEEELYIKYIDKDLVARFGEKRVLEAYGDGLDSYTFADMRLKKRIYGKLVWEESDFLTKLVGYEYSQMQYQDENFDLENDPHAILYYYGYVGAALYICLLGYFILRLAKELIKAFKNSLNLFNFAILITFGLQLGLSAYAGYLLRRPNVSIYLMVVLLFIHCRTNPLKKGREA